MSIDLLNGREGYKPFRYPWAYKAYLRQRSLHWTRNEVNTNNDLNDHLSLPQNDKSVIEQILRFFTQSDIDVLANYNNNLNRILGGHSEIAMMLSANAFFETIHIDAYALLNETLNLEESEYKKFLDIPAMYKKHEYLNKYNLDNVLTYFHLRQFIPKSLKKLLSTLDKKYNRMILISMALYGAFVEGLQLYASFAMLLNYSRNDKFVGMGQVVTWSIRDESLHVECMLQLFKTFGEQSGLISNNKLDKFCAEQIYKICKDIVEMEDDFIDLVYSTGAPTGLSIYEIKRYIRFVADYRLEQLGLKPIYNIQEHPLPWLRDMLDLTEHANFFETSVTEYTSVNINRAVDWTKVFKSRLLDQK